jgi:hypothetical protein
MLDDPPFAWYPKAAFPKVSVRCERVDLAFLPEVEALLGSIHGLVQLCRVGAEAASMRPPPQ